MENSRMSRMIICEGSGEAKDETQKYGSEQSLVHYRENFRRPRSSLIHYRRKQENFLSLKWLTEVSLKLMKKCFLLILG
jgi:nuclear transport factor 2 (NTF2) superfamily protein